MRDVPVHRSNRRFRYFGDGHPPPHLQKIKMNIGISEMRGLTPIPAAAAAATALVWPAVSGALWGPQHWRSGLWYAMLSKPAFQPPNVAIPVAWTAIDSGLAVGGYRLLRHPPTHDRNRALGWWAANVVLIGGWNGIFFGRRNLPVSTLAAAAMVGTGIAYVAQARKVDRPAAASGIVYVAWLAFATVLTAALWRRNRKGH